MTSDQTKLNLRIKGIDSYLNAVMAIDAFTQAIQDDCRSVLQNHITDLEAATELRFSKKGITTYSEPLKNKSTGKIWPGQWATVGVELEDSKRDKVWSIDAGVYWEYAESQPSAFFYSGFYTRNLTDLNRMYSALRPYCDERFEEDKTYCSLILWGDNPVDTDKQYRPEALEKLLRSWISVWKKAGGVSKVFSNAKNKK